MPSLPISTSKHSLYLIILTNYKWLLIAIPLNNTCLAWWKERVSYFFRRAFYPMYNEKEWATL
jgi:hypothetical protein